MSSFHDAQEKQKRIQCFMDGIDWQHHLGADSFGTKLYPSKMALVEDKNHSLDKCGIVEVEVRLVKWVKPQNLHRPEPPEDTT